MRKLIALALLALPVKAHAIRAVMEQVPASANTIFIDTQAVAVGIATAPASGTKLDVNGLSQFGTTGKSTFTATGALNMASGTAITLSGSGGKIVSNSSATASAFFGDGANLTNLSASNISGGSMGSSVIASSIAYKAVNGPSINGSTIPVSALNQSGAALNQVIGWNGSIWAPANASGGDAILASTQTFSGADTFLSTVTVGPSVIVGTITYKASMFNVWYQCASTAPAGSSIVYFYGLSDSYKYRLNIELLQNTSGANHNLKFNDDGGNNYYYSFLGYFVDTTAGNSNGNGVGFISMSNDQTPNAGAYFSTSFTIHPVVRGSSPIVGVRGGGFVGSSTSTGYSFDGGGQWRGASTLSNMSYSTTAGTLTGRISVDCLLPLPAL